MSSMRILYVDIETTPMLTYTWTLNNPGYINPAMLVHGQYVLTWAAKWAGNKTVFSEKLTPVEAVERDDSRIIEKLASLLRKADLVVAHNGDRFDLPHINTRVAEAKLEPLPPIRTIDTLKLVRKNFKFPSNKLDYLATFLELAGKHDSKLEWWLSGMRGDDKALKKMRRYNKQDVVLLENVFEEIRPYVHKLRRMSDGLGCPYCGSSSQQRRGYDRTQGSTFVKYQCQSCLKYYRERSGDPELKPEYMPL